MASNPFDAFDPPAPKKQGNPFDVFDAPAEQPVVNQPVSQPVVQVEKAAPVAAAPSVADAFKVATPNDPQLLPPGQGVLLPQPQMRGIGGGARQLGQSLNPDAPVVGQWESLLNSGLSSWYGKDMASAENNFFELVGREEALQREIVRLTPKDGGLVGPRPQRKGPAPLKPRSADLLEKAYNDLASVRSQLVEARKYKDEMEAQMARISGRTADVHAFQAAANKEDIGAAARLLKGDYGTNAAEVGINMALESAWPSLKGALIDVGKAGVTYATGGLAAPFVYGGGAVAQGGSAGRDAYVGNKAQNFKEWLQQSGVDPNDEDAVIALRDKNPVAFRNALSGADRTALAGAAAEGAVTGGFSLIPGSTSIKAVGKNKGVQFILKNGVPLMIEAAKEGVEEAVVSGASQSAEILAGSKKPFSWKQVGFAGTGGFLAGGASVCLISHCFICCTC